MAAPAGSEETHNTSGSQGARNERRMATDSGRSGDLVYNLRGVWLEAPSGGQATRIASRPVPRQSALLPILMYHHIRPIDPKTGADPYARELTVSPTQFELQLRYLKERGISSVSMDDLALYLQGRKDLPNRSVILTFDDGYEDHYLIAFPLLGRYGLRGTFFVTTGLVGLEGYLTWSELRWMVAAGMEVGSHSVAHIDLTRVTPTQRETELVKSRQELEKELGVSVQTIAYPSGSYNQDVMAAARKAGYILAVTTKYGAIHDRSKPLELSRVRIGGSDALATFQAKIEQFFPARQAAAR